MRRWLTRNRAAIAWIVVIAAVASIWLGTDLLNGPEPTARCYDGTLSYSKHHQGTCSWHGGVDVWLDGGLP